MKIDKAWNNVGKAYDPEVARLFREAVRSGRVTVEHGTTRLQFATYDVATGRKIGECFR